MKSKKPIVTNYRDKEAAEAQAAFLEANRGAAARMRAEERIAVAAENAAIRAARRAKEQDRQKSKVERAAIRKSYRVKMAEFKKALPPLREANARRVLTLHENNRRKVEALHRENRRKVEALHRENRRKATELKNKILASI